MVERIIRTNDQPISLFLQQKLQQTKSESTKALIFEAISQNSTLLMKNRFGNFLMQKCFEVGSVSQIRTIHEKLIQNVLELSCDRFGCHVVQKAVERIDEEMKVRLVSKMFGHINETIVHRFASHVWQRIFEIKWKTPFPNLYEGIHDNLNGKWTEVANNEHGSLVVQCIFENALPHQKEMIISEILDNVQKISKGNSFIYYTLNTNE